MSPHKTQRGSTLKLIVKKTRITKTLEDWLKTESIRTGLSESVIISIALNEYRLTKGE